MLTKARIRLVRSLADKEARRDNGLFVVEGAKMVAEALNSSASVEAVYFVPGGKSGGWEARGGEAVSHADMERMSRLKTPSDVLAVVRIPEMRGVRKYGSGLVLFLDGIQDPGNLGTIIRIADWFGICDVVCSLDSADCYNPKVVQATMGAVFRVNVSYACLVYELEAARERGTEVYGTFLEGEDIYSTGLSPEGIVLMGSEGRGVSPEVSAFVTRKLFIPPFPADRRGSESLNVAAATALVCAEFRRRIR